MFKVPADTKVGLPVGPAKIKERNVIRTAGRDPSAGEACRGAMSRGAL